MSASNLEVEESRRLTVNSEENPTRLYSLLCQNSWSDATSYLLSESTEEASTWITRNTSSQQELYLPLHLACRHCNNFDQSLASTSVSPTSSSFSSEDDNVTTTTTNKKTPSLVLIQKLVRSYPDAVRMPDHLGNLPIHHAIKSNAPPTIISTLLSANPQSIDTADDLGSSPINSLFSSVSPASRGNDGLGRLFRELVSLTSRSASKASEMEIEKQDVMLQLQHTKEELVRVNKSSSLMVDSDDVRDISGIQAHVVDYNEDADEDDPISNFRHIHTPHSESSGGAFNTSSELKRLQEEVNHLQDSNEVLRTTIQELTKEYVEKLRSMTSDHKQESTILEVAYKKEAEDLSHGLQIATDKLTSTESKLAAVTEKLQSVTAELETSQIQVRYHMERSASFEKQLNEVKSMGDVLRGEVRGMLEKVKQAKLEKDSLRTRMDVMSQTLDAAKKEREALMKENENLTDRLRSTETSKKHDVRETKKVRDDLTTRLTDLTDQLVEADQDRDDLRVQLNMKEKEAIDLKGRIDALNLENLRLHGMNKNIQKMNRDAAAAAELYETLNKQLDAVRAEGEDWRVKWVESSRLAEKLKREGKDLRKEKENMNRMNIALKGQIEKLEASKAANNNRSKLQKVDPSVMAERVAGEDDENASMAGSVAGSLAGSLGGNSPLSGTTGVMGVSTIGIPTPSTPPSLSRPPLPRDTNSVSSNTTNTSTDAPNFGGRLRLVNGKLERSGVQGSVTSAVDSLSKRIAKARHSLAADKNAGDDDDDSTVVTVISTGGGESVELGIAQFTT